MPLKRRFRDKYASRSPERIWCLNSVRLVLSFERFFSFISLFFPFFYSVLLKREKQREKEETEFFWKIYIYDGRESQVWLRMQRNQIFYVKMAKHEHRNHFKREQAAAKPCFFKFNDVSLLEANRVRSSFCPSVQPSVSPFVHPLVQSVFSSCPIRVLVKKQQFLITRSMMCKTLHVSKRPSVRPSVRSSIRSSKLCWSKAAIQTKSKLL